MTSIKHTLGGFLAAILDSYLYTVLNVIAATFSDAFWSQSFTFVRYLIINSLFMRELFVFFIF